MKIPKNTPLSIQKLDVAFAWVMETVVHNESEHCLVNAAVKKLQSSSTSVIIQAPSLIYHLDEKLSHEISPVRNQPSLILQMYPREGGG